VYSPVAEGGLSIKNVRMFNATLLAKWLWRLRSKEKGVWRDIIESRYGSCREMRSIMGYQKVVAWWRDLGKVCNIHNQSNWFDSRIN